MGSVELKGACVWCDGPIGPRDHLRAYETVADVCCACRREWRTGQVFTLRNALVWAWRGGFDATRTKIQRRLEKKLAHRAPRHAHR